MKKILCVLLMCLTASVAYAQDDWKNDLRTKFLNNETVIMEINIRSFNAKDLDGDGFIQEDRGEERGTFLNAIDRLDELKNLGINTLHILPITPVGKLKALGSAGSLYAAADFTSINKDMYDQKSDLTPENQVKKFIQEAHKRGIYLIVDVPACGSYDLYLQRPDLFETTSSGDPVLPSDWTDVRLLATGSEDKVNANVYSFYKDFVKYVINLGFDGIRADVATCKTGLFWKELIEYSRKKDPEFLWLAEAYEADDKPIADKAVFTPYTKLLDAGFDGYYGGFSGIKDWKTAQELISNISTTLNGLPPSKSVIGSFTTHDEVSPITLKGEEFSRMIIWLNATLPLNSYFVDGFQTGDDYNYIMGNKTAPHTNTDDEIYFVHRGKIDIFNLSRKPQGNYSALKNDFFLGNNVKKSILPVLNNGTFTPIKQKNPNIFAYYFEYNKKIVLTVGNFDFINEQKTEFKTLKGNKDFIPLKVTNMPSVNKDKLIFNLNAGEIVVLMFMQ